MTTSEPISIPGLPRDAPQARIDEVIGGLVREFHVPIKLEDEPDADGNCVIEVSAGSEEIIQSLAAKVEERA